MFDLDTACGFRLLRCDLVSGLFGFGFEARWFVGLRAVICLLACGW